MGPFHRLTKITVAIGLAATGPGVLYKVIEALISGEVRNRGAIIATAEEQPFEFYTMTLIVGSGAALVTALGVAGCRQTGGGDVLAKAARMSPFTGGSPVKFR